MNARLVEFSPGLRLVEVDLGVFAVRGAVAAGARRALVFDTLSRPEDMACVRPLVEGADYYVVYSHADWDHVWGTAGLPAAGRTILAQEAARERFRTDVPAELAAKKAEFPGLYDGVELVGPDAAFRDGLDLDLGGLTVELRALPGHTADSLVAFLPETGVLLAGDTVELPLPCIQDAASVPGWIEALSTWAGDPRLKQVIPSHGPLGGAEVIRGTIDYLQALAQGRNPISEEGLTDFYRRTHRENLALFGLE